MILGLVAALPFTPAPAADYALGLAAFERGDLAVAESQFTPLAEAGLPDAQYSLAMLYLKSEPPDYARARPWLEKSARLGLTESQYMLGMLTLYGVGTTKNAEQGMKWLERAEENGNEDAQALLEQLRQARLQEAKRARRKAEQARDLRAELARAEAAEEALKKRLAQSREREKSLAAEQQNLIKARASDKRVKEEMRVEQARLEAALESLRRQLADAERAREAAQAAKAEAAVVAPSEVSAETKVEDVPGEAVVSGEVVEILPDGVLLSGVSRRMDGRSEPFPEDFVVFLSLASTDGLSAGQKVTYPAEPATPYRYKYESGATGRIRAYRVIEKTP